MTPETNKKIRSWFLNTCCDGHPIESMSEQNQYNARNMLGGFLQASELFGIVSHGESAQLFRELAK